MPKPIIKRVFEQLGEQVKDTANGVAKAPVDIVKTALGQSESTNSPDPLETNPQSAGSQKPITNQSQITDPLIAKKKAELESSQAQIRLHQDRLKEEQEYFSIKEAEKKQAEKQDELQEREEEQQQIVQIRRQEEKDAALQPASTGPKGPMSPLGMTAKKKKGTIESGRLKD